MDAKGLREHYRRRQDPREDELPLPPPVGTNHHDFGITCVGGELREVANKLGEEEGNNEKEIWMCIAGARAQLI